MLKKPIALLLFVFLISCGGEENTIQITTRKQVVEHDVYARNLSITPSENGIVCTYGDEITLSLKQAKVTDTVQVSFIDNIDLETRLNPIFGRHYFFNSSGGEDLFYFDYQKKNTKIFKYLTREKEEDLFSVTPLPINCKSFSVARLAEKYLILYNDNGIKIGILEGKNFTKAAVNNFDYPQSDMRLVNAGEKLYLLFKDNSNNLCWSRIIQEGPESFTITYPTLVDKEVQLYDAAVKDDKLLLLYYKEDYSLNYFDGEAKKIGYFAELSDLHLMLYRDNPLFLYISFEESQEPGEAVYGLYACYQYGEDKWAEETLYTSKTTLFSLDTLADDSSINVVVGGDNILLFNLEISDNKEKKTQVTVDRTPIIRYKLHNDAG